ncbi:MAG: hypothetical protein J6B89_02075 [Bacilli bacterium]|nr:hypothetical protein [Bacilli bacterium]
MSKNVKYIKNDKVYTVKKTTLKIKNWLIYLVLPAILLTSLGGLCLIHFIFNKDDNRVVSYNEIGNIDYKVYLKDNNYYKEKFLKKDMQYIASLINSVNVNFKYDMHSTKNIDYNYRYKITANLVVTDKIDSNKVLYEDEEILLDEVVKSVSGNSFIIREDVDIDYDKYNDYANKFRSDYGLSANCNLILTMDIGVVGDYEYSNKDIKSNNKLQISIPLSEQTVDIKMNASNINKSSSLTGDYNIEIDSIIILVAGSVLSLFGIIMGGVAIYLYVTKHTKDAYQVALRKILKNYDANIVNAKNNFKESGSLVRVEKFEELLDAQKLENTPILFYEVEPGNKSYFVVKGSKLTYRFTLTRAYQERKMMEQMCIGMDNE